MKGTKHLDGDKDPLAKASAVASHPLMAYRLIKRFASEIEALGRDFARDIETRTFNFLNTTQGSKSSII
jgi:hypothetical protein